MNYNGGKGGAGVYQQIINRMPKHTTYIETHTGGGTILLKKKKAAKNIAIEIDVAVIEKFKRSHTDIIDDGISFVNGDCIDFINNYNFTSQVLIYSDPPYLFETRKSKKDLYKYEYDTNRHIELIKTLDSLECFVMISGYESQLYSEMLNKSKWHLFTFNAMSRQGPRTEALWCNFDPDNYIKHDYTYMGENFRERERIKKKTQRWVNNLEKLPMDERNYLLSNIAETFNLELSNYF